MNPEQAADLRNALLSFASRQPVMAKASLPKAESDAAAATQGVVLPYRAAGPRRTPARATLTSRRPRPAVAAAR
jgi:hypothetical protein